MDSTIQKRRGKVHHAHGAAGFCDVSFSTCPPLDEGGWHAVTCGADGKITIRLSKNMEEAMGSVDAKDAQTGVAVSPLGDRFCVADASNYVKVYSLPDGQFQDVVTKFVLPPRCLSFSPSGMHLAAGGDDDMIKMIDVGAKKVFKSIQSGAYVRGIAYDPESQFLAVTCADGTFAVYEIASGKVMMKKKKGSTRMDPTAPNRVVPSWHPDGGQLVAVPKGDGSISLYERLSWEETDELAGGHDGPVHCVAFCPNGLYLASSAEDSKVVVWDVNEKRILEVCELPGNACGLAWHPKDNCLVCVTEGGDLVEWDQVISDGLLGPGDAVDDGGIAENGPDEDLKDNEYGSDLDRNDDTFVVDDDDGMLTVPKKKRVHVEDPGVERHMKRFHSASAAPPQQPFQPGSTDLVMGRRYLSYNSLGCITLRSESDHNIVEVNFHDTAIHRRRIPLLNDFYGFTMGTLGTEGALYASPSSDHSPSTVVFRPFEPWSANTDWTVGLPQGEEACSVAVGDSFCVVANNLRMIRLFTLAGLQTNVISTPGDIVCVFAQDDAFGVVYHAGNPTTEGDQILDVQTYQFSSGKKEIETRVCLSSAAQLAWIGFTDEHALATYDSEGILRVFSPDFGGSWTPVFDASKERKGSEIFWLFSVSLAANEVQCIVCADTVEPVVPSGSARPVITAAPLQLPLVPGDTKMAQSEANMMRAKLLLSQLDPTSFQDSDILAESESAYDRASLSLFKSLLEQDRASRALEVARRMLSKNALEGALRLANHFNIGALIEKIELLQEEQRMDDQQLDWMDKPIYDSQTQLGNTALDTELANGGQPQPENGEPNMSVEPHVPITGNPFAKIAKRANPFARKRV